MLFSKKDKNLEFLREILKDKDLRDGVLGINRFQNRTVEKMSSDASHVVLHSRSEDYAVWSKQAWDDFLLCMNALLDPDLDPLKVEFHRGGLRKTIDLLRISYEAHEFKKTNAVKEENKRQFSNSI